MRPLTEGARLGPYEILAQLGAGGMGDVFRARDTRLGRLVAIKVCREEFSERIEREARAISALNHPHICTLYDVGPDYLVMELVDGETLSARLKSGGLPVELVLQYGAQIADALAAAHAQGIIHRDLKPANIMVTNAGVKLLDFGLAKPTLLNEPSANTGETTAAALTAPQAIVGTLSYMAPEQLEGKRCDTRSDIFSLGLVLYEMATGTRAFSGDSQAVLIADILRGQPAPMTTMPQSVRHVVERCLAKDPDERWQAARDVRLELQWAARPVASPAAGVVTESRRGWLWAGVGVAAALLITATVQWPRQAPAERSAHLTLSFDRLTGEAGPPVPSPDGRNFVFSALGPSGRRSLWLRPLDGQGVRQLPGTEDAEQPCWSADGTSIRFHAQGKLKKVGLSDGNPQTVADTGTTTAAGLAGVGTACNAAGDVIWSPGNRTALVHIREGGSPRPLTRLATDRGENSHRYPVFLPDGRRFLFVARSNQRENNALYLGSLDSTETRRLMAVQSNVSYVPPRTGRQGAILHVRDGMLVAQPFDGEKTTGEPASIVENVEYAAASLLALFAMSSDGTVLIFHSSGPGRRQFMSFDRTGKGLGAIGAPGDYVTPRIANDGTRVVFARPDDQTGNRDIWSMEMPRGNPSRLTTNPANDWLPIWSPDGKTILFSSDRGSPVFRAYVKNSFEPAGDEMSLFQVRDPDVSINPTDWSRSGTWMVFTRDQAGSGAPPTVARDLWILRTGSRTPLTFVAGPFDKAGARFSPDEKWIAYVSNETGGYEVYVRSFSGGPSTGAPKIQISIGGGDYPVWRRDGRELFFIGADLKLYAVDTSDFQRPGAALRPSALFTPCSGTIVAGLPGRSAYWEHPYDVFPDNQRFLVNCRTSDPSRFDVVLNWTHGLK